MLFDGKDSFLPDQKGIRRFMKLDFKPAVKPRFPSHDVEKVLQAGGADPCLADAEHYLSTGWRRASTNAFLE